MIGAGQSEGQPPKRKRPSFLRSLHRKVVVVEPWSILVAGLALLMTVVQFWVDYQDRVNERVVRAWSLVTTPAPVTAASGRRSNI